MATFGGTYFGQDFFAEGSHQTNAASVLVHGFNVPVVLGNVEVEDGSSITVVGVSSQVVQGIANVSVHGNSGEVDTLNGTEVTFTGTGSGTGIDTSSAYVYIQGLTVPVKLGSVTTGGDVTVFVLDLNGIAVAIGHTTATGTNDQPVVIVSNNDTTDSAVLDAYRSKYEQKILESYYERKSLAESKKPLTQDASIRVRGIAVEVVKGEPSISIGYNENVVPQRRKTIRLVSPSAPKKKIVLTTPPISAPIAEQIIDTPDLTVPVSEITEDTAITLGVPVNQQPMVITRKPIQLAMNTARVPRVLVRNQINLAQ